MYDDDDLLWGKLLLFHSHEHAPSMLIVVQIVFKVNISVQGEHYRTDIAAKRSRFSVVRFLALGADLSPPHKNLLRLRGLLNGPRDSGSSGPLSIDFTGFSGKFRRSGGTRLYSTRQISCKDDALH